MSGDHGDGARSELPRKGFVRRRLLDAALEVVAERGFGQLSLQEVVERAGTDSITFHRQFESVEDCFTVAYGVAVEGLCEEILAAGRDAEDWRPSFRAGLRSFLRFVAEEPALARVLLLEDRVAGGAVAEKRDDVVQRLSRAIDLARQEVGPSPAPPMAARVIVGAIEHSMIELILSGQTEQAEERASTLAYYAILVFYGSDAAREELER